MPLDTLSKWFPVRKAGSLAETSIRLSSSLRLGSRHFPAVDPSLSPQAPSASCVTSVTAFDHVVGSNQPVFFSQMSPLTWLVTVPSWLSVKRIAGQATPFDSEASSPLA